jgi:nitrate reductase gamma subunit
MDFLTTEVRLVLMILAVGAVGALLAFLLARKATRRSALVLLPAAILLILAIAAVIKAMFFANQSFEDLAYAVMAIILGGASLVAGLVGIIILVFRRQKKPGAQ